tara:strand:- start:1875 stop:3050 length:1176 start_codon:yes stop_codon:yes gene_type:complete
MKDSPSPHRFVASHLLQVPRSGIRDFFEIVATRDDVLSLGIGEPDFVTPWQIRDAAIYALDHGATSYTPNRGQRVCRRAIAGYLESSFGLAYDPDQEILVTVGVSEALDLAVRAVVEPGDEVLYHEPGYVSYGPLVAFAHGVPVPVATEAAENFVLRRSQLDAVVSDRTKALILNFPTNPTGGVLEHSTAEEIAAFAIEHDLIVITDEIYSELTYEGERITIAALPGMRERTIFLHGQSKAWAMTGFRSGYACGPAELVEAMMKIHQYSMLCAPILSQAAVVEALKRSSSHVEHMRSEYEKRRNLMLAAFKDMGLACTTPRGAFYAFPSIARTGLSSIEFATRLVEEEAVAVVPGTAFGASGEGHVRCSFAANLEHIKEAMERMARFVQRH